MKKIFITGGAGNVGCRLVPILLKKKSVDSTNYCIVTLECSLDKVLNS